MFKEEKLSPYAVEAVERVINSYARQQLREIREIEELRNDSEKNRRSAERRGFAFNMILWKVSNSLRR